MEILHNQILITAFIAWCISQVLKTITHLITYRHLDLQRLMGDGGMPSSHSATVTAMTLATGMTCGWDSALFAVTAVFALIVMHDAKGVRQETGKQAKVINNMLEFFEAAGRGDLTPEESLKEFVGHTRWQVYAGAVLGAVVAVCMYWNG